MLVEKTHKSIVSTKKVQYFFKRGRVSGSGIVALCGSVRTNSTTLLLTLSFCYARQLVPTSVIYFKLIRVLVSLGGKRRIQACNNNSKEPQYISLGMSLTNLPSKGSQHISRVRSHNIFHQIRGLNIFHWLTAST